MTRRILLILFLSPLLVLACKTVTYSQFFEYGYPIATDASVSAMAGDATVRRYGANVSVIGPVTPVNVEDDAGDILFMAGHPGAVTGTFTLDASVTIVGQVAIATDAGQVFTPAPAALTSLNSTGAVPKIGLVLCDAGASCTLCQLIVGNESNTPANCGLFAVAAIPTSWTSTAPSQVFPLPAGGTPQAYSEMDWGNGCITSAAGWTVACSTAGPGDGGAGQLAWSAVTANIDITGWGCVGSGCIP
jgi:hypothetical protein